MSNLQITTRSISPSPAVNHLISKYFGNIQQHYHKINHCHVVIDIEKRHLQHKLFNLNIDIVVCGREIVVSRIQNENLYIAIRDAFLALEKLLDKNMKRKHSHIDKVARLRNIELVDTVNLTTLV